MKTIVLKKEELDKEPIILLLFPYNDHLKELVKRYQGSKWNAQLKAWTVPYHDDQLNILLAFFKGRVWLDYSGLNKPTAPKQHPDLPLLSPAHQKERAKFVDWMRNKRYSESTIDTYSGGISMFFRFLDNKPLEQINNDDLERFNKEYIIGRKYSASF